MWHEILNVTGCTLKTELWHNPNFSVWSLRELTRPYPKKADTGNVLVHRWENWGLYDWVRLYRIERIQNIRPQALLDSAVHETDLDGVEALAWESMLTVILYFLMTCHAVAWYLLAKQSSSIHFLWIQFEFYDHTAACISRQEAAHKCTQRQFPPNIQHMNICSQFFDSIQSYSFVDLISGHYFADPADRGKRGTDDITDLCGYVFPVLVWQQQL